MIRYMLGAVALAAVSLLPASRVDACDAALQLQGQCQQPQVQQFVYAATQVAQFQAAYAAPVAAVRVRRPVAVVAAPVVATARVRVQKQHLSLFKRRVAVGVGAQAVVAAPY